MSAFVVCGACRRHVREGEASCPFCRGVLAPAVAPAVPRLSRRELTRGAIYALGASLLVGACGGSGEGTEVSSGGGEETEQMEVVSDGASGDGASGDDVHEDVDWRLQRVVPDCVHQGTCAAPPYGAPPGVERLI